MGREARELGDDLRGNESLDVKAFRAVQRAKLLHHESPTPASARRDAVDEEPQPAEVIH